jgi:hypothetical protein
MDAASPSAAPWEYCVVAPTPSGPMVVTVTFYLPEGARFETHKAETYDDAISRLWPSVIAGLGRAGWELVAVDQGTWHFKRPLPTSR